MFVTTTNNMNIINDLTQYKSSYVTVMYKYHNIDISNTPLIFL